jgi:NAD(P)-dependent dehydrogenase (short-subunit alcohol dehydrogenase family)
VAARRALITGASRGIGAAIAGCYREAGYDVLTPTRSEMDLGDPESVNRYAADPSVRSVDVLVNNAGENNPLPIGEIELEAAVLALNVNLLGPFLLTKHLGVAMAERGWGRIVNISSVYGIVGRPKRSLYTTTKSAINGLTTAAAIEFAPGNVLVNAVCPGFVDTELTRKNNTPEEIARLSAQVPLGRLAQPDEIARLVFFLGSEQNSYISGQAIVIDGGFLAQ